MDRLVVDGLELVVDGHIMHVLLVLKDGLVVDGVSLFSSLL